MLFLNRCCVLTDIQKLFFMKFKIYTYLIVIMVVFNFVLRMRTSVCEKLDVYDRNLIMKMHAVCSITIPNYRFGFDPVGDWIMIVDSRFQHQRFNIFLRDQVWPIRTELRIQHLFHTAYLTIITLTFKTGFVSYSWFDSVAFLNVSAYLTSFVSSHLHNWFVLLWWCHLFILFLSFVTLIFLPPVPFY